MLLKECEDVESQDVISFIFVVHIDYSKKSLPIPEPEVEASAEKGQAHSQQSDQSKKRNADEIQGHKDELAKKEKESDAMKRKIDDMGDQFDCGICYLIMH